MKSMNDESKSRKVNAYVKAYHQWQALGVKSTTADLKSTAEYRALQTRRGALSGSQLAEARRILGLGVLSK